VQSDKDWGALIDDASKRGIIKTEEKDFSVDSWMMFKKKHLPFLGPPPCLCRTQACPCHSSAHHYPCPDYPAQELFPSTDFIGFLFDKKMWLCLTLFL